MGNKTTTKHSLTNNETVDSTSFSGKTHDEIKGMIQNLQAQLQETRVQAHQANQLVLKLEGALEFGLQLLPQEDTNDTKNVD